MNAVGVTVGSQKTATGVKSGLLGRSQFPGFPEYVGAGKGGMTAEIDLDRWREPAQVVPIRPLDEKRSFGQVHLRRYILHPGSGAWRWQEAHGGGISREWPVGKCIHLKYLLSHTSV